MRLRGRVTRLTVENLDLRSSLDRGDSRSAIILTQLQVIERSENELVQALKRLKSECSDLFEVSTHFGRLELSQISHLAVRI